MVGERRKSGPILSVIMTKSKLKQYLRLNPDINSKELLDYLTTPERFEFQCGGSQYTLNGKLHRIDGPAIEWSCGDKEWYKHGKRHRTDGPAIEYQNGDKEWWVNGIQTDSNFRSLK
jgi:hypothetical protein